MQKQKDSSFFVVRTMAISFLVVVGSLTLLPSGQAHAQGRRVASSGIVKNTVVYDVSDNRYYTYNASTLFVTGSSMKVPIMLTFFDMIEREGRGPTNHEYGLLRTMIENSNNASASALYYGEIGGAAGVASYMRRIGIIGLYPNPDAWGWSLIYPSTMVHLLTRLYEGTILTPYHRSLAFYYMEHVEADQQVGVGDTAPEGATVALKDGWVLAPDGLWAMNSSGIVMLGRETYVIAAYTREDPSLLAGHNAMRQICAQVTSKLD
jgi:Beta-lactamase enzyme family